MLALGTIPISSPSKYAVRPQSPRSVVRRTYAVHRSSSSSSTRPLSQTETSIAGLSEARVNPPHPRVRGLNGLLRFATGLHRTRATRAEQPEQQEPRSVEKRVRIHCAQDIAVVVESPHRGERRREVGHLLKDWRGHCTLLQQGRILDSVLRHCRV